MSKDDLERDVRLLAAHRAIEQQIYRMGYALEDGDFEVVGELLQHATFGADMIGRRVFTGRDEIRGRSCTAPPQRTGGFAAETTTPSTELLARFRQTTSSSGLGCSRGAPFAMLVAGRYEDEWAVIDGDWHWTDRFIVVQFKNDLDRHMHSGSQPYN